MKKSIAIAACETICDKESIIIESSTTNILLSVELLKKPEKLYTLTIITNSIRIALLLELGENVKDCICSEGRLMRKSETALELKPSRH